MFTCRRDAMATKAEEQREESNRAKLAHAEFKRRLTPLRRAHEQSQKGNVPKAVEHYLTYIGILGRYNNVPVDNLSPNHFDMEKDQAELLLLSQVYWDLAKAYDRNPRLKPEAEKYLAQFVKFTIGFKYQYLNSELLRKYIKKRQSYNIEGFKRAYKEIRVSSKKCYIATYCFGENHKVTSDLRLFKFSIQHTLLGDKLIEIYYRISPKIIYYCEKHNYFSYFLKTILSPVLLIFAKVVRGHIIGK